MTLPTISRKLVDSYNEDGGNPENLLIYKNSSFLNLFKSSEKKKMSSMPTYFKVSRVPGNYTTTRRRDMP